MIILVNYFNMLNLTYVGFSIKWHVNEVYALFSLFVDLIILPVFFF